MKGAMSRRYARFKTAVRKETAKSKESMPPRPAGHTLNHIIPVSRAFAIGLTPEETGSVANLEWTPFQKNIEQGQRMTKHSITVLRALGRHNLAEFYEWKLTG